VVLRKIRTQFVPCLTLCQRNAVGLIGILVEADGRYAVRQAFVPLQVFAESGPHASQIQEEITRYGTLCDEAVARAWFPEIAGLDYMTDADLEISDDAKDDGTDDDDDESDFQDHKSPEQSEIDLHV